MKTKIFHIGRYTVIGSGADCKSVAFWFCGFKSLSADYAVVPQLVEELFGRQSVDNIGLQVRILSAAL